MDLMYKGLEKAITGHYADGLGYPDALELHMELLEKMYDPCLFIGVYLPVARTAFLTRLQEALEHRLGTFNITG